MPGAEAPQAVGAVRRLGQRAVGADFVPYRAAEVPGTDHVGGAEGRYGPAQKAVWRGAGVSGPGGRGVRTESAAGGTDGVMKRAAGRLPAALSYVENIDYTNLPVLCFTPGPMVGAIVTLRRN